MSRYLPDPGTPPVAQFVRGDLRITAAINQVVSQVGHVMSIDVKASSAIINFTPQWSSTPISAQDLAGITLLIRNALKTGFLPSNAALPPNIGHIQFKGMTAAPAAVAVLLDMADGPVIQRASERALENRFGLDEIFDLVQQTRREIETPIILFSYFNPLLQYGGKRLCEEAQRVGIDGVLVTDLTPEEATEFSGELKAHVYRDAICGIAAKGHQWTKRIERETRFTDGHNRWGYGNGQGPGNRQSRDR